MTLKLEELGIEFDDPWDIVTEFENQLATYAGSKYAVCVDSCSNAIFLCLQFLNIFGKILEIPKNTYASVPMQCIHAGNKIKFIDKEWSGEYFIGDTPIVDAATKFCKGMYIENSYYCVSFHHRKILKIGRGGVILTNDINFVEWVRPMIYDGRNKNKSYIDDELSCIGYHMYMTPEDAAIGLTKLQDIKDVNQDSGSNLTYKDLSTQKVFLPYVI